MKFSKTFCRPSSSVEIVPVGLPLKLQYNQNGLLQQYYIGLTNDLDPTYDDFDSSDPSIHNSIFAQLRKIVPNSISVTGGTTWVYGVLYSDNIPCDEGLLPQALYSSYVNELVKGGNFEFYAGYVHSLAGLYRGPLVIRNMLSVNKFNLLPHIIVPLTMTDDTLQQIMNPGSYPFKYSFIAGFFIFEELDCRYFGQNLLQVNVKNDVDPYVASDGYFKGDIVTNSGRTYTFNYSAILHHQVTKDCTLLLERDEGSCLNILSTRVSKNIEKVPDNIAQNIKCPVCGKVFRGGDSDAPIQCDDPHCLSHEYDNAVKMLNTFKLPTLSYNSYKALVDSRKIICLTDLMDLPPCQDVEIETTLANAMYAVIPSSVVPNFDILERFVNRCNNSVETVVYYLQNPKRMETDLDLVDPLAQRLINWLEDPYNVTTLTTIFSRVKITARQQKFDGAPIFRGVTLAITGRFKRGDYPEIESILRSYAAEVVPEIKPGSKLPDAIIVGSLNDGISGEMIQKARIHNIPLQDEDDFFVKYEIDSDLAANLL